MTPPGRKIPVKQVGLYTLDFYNKDDDLVCREISEQNFVDTIKRGKEVLKTNPDVESFTIDMPRYNSKYDVHSKRD